MQPANDEVMNQVFKDLMNGRAQWINGNHAPNQMWMMVGETKVVLTAETE